MQRLKIGYLTDTDPGDRRVWSGIIHYMFRALERRGCAVAHLGRSVMRRSPSLLERGLSKLGWARQGSRLGARDELTEARARSDRLRKELVDCTCDVIFAPVASRLLAFLETDTPIVYMSDTTWAQARNYYPGHEGVPDLISEQRHELDRRSILRADRLVYSSTWAAESAIRDYGADPEKVRVVPFGANLDEAPSADSLPDKVPLEVCRLVCIGTNWLRKGGDIALETLIALRDMGIDARLAIISGHLSRGRSLPEGATPIGYLDKNRPEHRRKFDQLLKYSHFLLLPTRADCTPIGPDLDRTRPKRPHPAHRSGGARIRTPHRRDIPGAGSIPGYGPVCAGDVR
jgi:hypothetical protein